jgi:hypothetical protein
VVACGLRRGPSAYPDLPVEAHRLTPTSQYLGAAAQLAELSHHLLLLTATPHRGKEHFFRALLHLLDPAVYTWDDAVKDYADMVLRPGRDNFLRRMKEDLRDLDGNLLFPPRFAETRDVHLTPAEADAYVAVMAYVDTWYDASSVLARSIYGKRAASCIPSALATLKRRAEVLGASQTGRVDRVAPRGFERPDFAGADVDSEEAWEAAERSVVEARSRDRKAELAAVQDIVGKLELALTSKDEPAKWQAARKLLADHGITPASGGQLLAARVPATQWIACSAGQGAKGRRLDDWTRIQLASPATSELGRWLLVRRSRSDGELAFYACYGPAATPLVGLVRVAGTRWAVEEGFEQAKGEVGLDHYQVRRWPGWYRHVTLALLAHAFLAVIRAQAASPERAKGDTAA